MPPSSILPTSKDADVLLTFAESLADACGRAVLPYFRANIEIENKSSNDFDPVTQADKRGELAIRDLIERHYPDHGIFGEEFERSNPEAPVQWVIDPIDGTRGFISGVPLWGTLIALCIKNVPVLGIIDHPFTDERFVGLNWDGKIEATYRRGNEATSMQTRNCTSLDQAILTCTTPEMFKTNIERNAFNLVEKSCKLSRYSMDCYGYGLLSFGSIDLVVEASMSPYDILALVPVVRASGGIISDWTGDPDVTNGQVLAAATPQLHEQALAILTKAAQKFSSD